MNSIKNAIVTVTLLAVGYGSYVVLKEPVPTQLAQQHAHTMAPANGGNVFDVPQINVQVGIDEPTGIDVPNVVVETNATNRSTEFGLGRNLSAPSSTPLNSRFDAVQENLPNVKLPSLNIPDVSETIETVKSAASNQFEKTKTLAKEKLEQLQSDLPPLPNLIDSAGTTKLPELVSNLGEELAEVTPDGLKLDDVAQEIAKPIFGKLQADVVEPLKARIEPPVAALAEPRSSNIPPPFAAKQTNNPFASPIANAGNDAMPKLPSVHNWDEYEGPQVSPEDLAKADFETPKPLSNQALSNQPLSNQAFPNQKTLEDTSNRQPLEPVRGLTKRTPTDQLEEITPQQTPSRFESPNEPFQNAHFQNAPQQKPVPQNLTSPNLAAQNLAAQPTANFQTAPPQFPSTAPAGEILNQHVKSSLTPEKIQGPVSSATTATGGNAVFERVWTEVQSLLAEKKYAKALRTLTPWNAESNLSEEQNTRCIQMLDQLAGTLIYSRKSYLDSSYVVQAGETLDEIAAKYAVPQELLAKINGIAPPYALTTGEELKVVRGPFRATVSLSRNELTLFAGPNYAGRFPVKIGRDLPPESAFYEIGEKSPGRTYFDRKLGREIIRNQENNRYGSFWMGLRGEHITTGHSVGIHGRPNVPIGDEVGSISLDPLDAEDVFSILSVGSRIEVRP